MDIIGALPEGGNEEAINGNENSDDGQADNFPVHSYERDAEQEGRNHENGHQDEGSVDSLPIFECPVRENVVSAQTGPSASVSHNSQRSSYGTIQHHPKSNQSSATNRSSMSVRIC